MGKKAATAFVCQSCAYSSPKWLGKCNDCGMWNSFVEENSFPSAKHDDKASNSSPVQSIEQIQKIEAELRLVTGIAEFDRVLGGGIVPGSLSLVGGEPGIGKSTLLLQVAGKLAEQGHIVFYVSGEESAHQIANRAKRLNINSPHLFVLHESNWILIEAAVKKTRPAVLILDSIQTTYSDELASAPGTVSQIREITQEVLSLSKSLSMPSFLIGHVNKEGSIAGPKVFEHMADTVIYFEGDFQDHYRLLRCMKNRFGNTDEVGIFEMLQIGLKEVSNPSMIFLEDNLTQSYGRALTCFVEGSRTLFVEIQALVIENRQGAGRRTTQGVDTNRLAMIVAVIEKNLGISLAFSDVYLNVVGGVKLATRASDLAIMAALLSSIRNIPIQENVIFLGELGLTGEVRKIPQMEQMLHEVAQLNYKKVVAAQRHVKSLSSKFQVELLGISKVTELEPILF